MTKTKLTKEIILELGFEYDGNGIKKKFNEHFCFAVKNIPETLEDLKCIFLKQMGMITNP